MLIRFCNTTTSSTADRPVQKKVGEEMSDWSIYLLVSSIGRTYVGYTRTATLLRRLRQHNGEIKGGAKATRFGRPWVMVASVDGLQKRPALQLEWRMHRRYPGPRGIGSRLNQLAAALNLRQWTSTAPLVASITSLRLSWYSESLTVPNNLEQWLQPTDSV